MKKIRLPILKIYYTHKHMYEEGGREGERLRERKREMEQSREPIIELHKYI
jgi:hypothetical protein